ncbi:hypothetical protein Ocin01_15035 [Orchesella cincta]|uniref:C2H2-type domain-containing protein n=1 Tax=Orchesella cincta TaxID=48709 RepID=A0A1D2MFJ2_ORCCI|nr:hypothetical protein Ocin01_15035 [Orchesella cincta]
MQRKETPEKVGPDGKLPGGGWADKNNNGQLPTTPWKFEVEPLFRCNVCGRGFYTSPLYIHHVGNVHTTPRALVEAAEAAAAQMYTAQLSPTPGTSAVGTSPSTPSPSLPSSPPAGAEAVPVSPSSSSDDEE